MLSSFQDKLERQLRCISLGNKTPLQHRSDHIPSTCLQLQEDYAENSCSDENDGKKIPFKGPSQERHSLNQSQSQQTNLNQHFHLNSGSFYGTREARLGSHGQKFYQQSELEQLQQHLHTNQPLPWPQNQSPHFSPSTHQSKPELFSMSHTNPHCGPRNNPTQPNPRNPSKDAHYCLNANKPSIWSQTHTKSYSSQTPQARPQLLPTSPSNSHVKQRRNRCQSNPMNFYHGTQINGMKQANTCKLNKNSIISGQIEQQILNLERLIKDIVPKIELDSRDIAENEAFRIEIEKTCREAILRYQQDCCSADLDISDIELRCFGSMITGFATKSSDMDLALLFPRENKLTGLDDTIIARLLEKVLLDLGYGARLLTKTMIPIIKVCQKPTPKLLADLRNARSDWEDYPDHDDDELQSEAILEAQLIVDQEFCKSQNDLSPIRKDSEKIERSSYESMLINLKQEKFQSLDNYCTTARRFLRRLGGCDISTNCSELCWEKRIILNEVCKAFILGLSSNRLSIDLRALKSNRSLFDDTYPFTQQSLEAVFIQAEGEQLSAAWDCRPCPEATELNESVAREYVQIWRSLRDIEVSMTEISAHNRQLLLACSNLKKIPSLQLMFLEQTQLEDPNLYMERAMKIMRSLQPPENPDINAIISIVISHYISGIKSDNVRELLQDSDHTGVDLKQVGILHLVLQLASDYEYALGIGLYTDGNQELVREFVSILKSMNLNRLFLPSDASTTSLVFKLRNLPDPTKISQNSGYRYYDPLQFPKANIGVQCDINFSAELAIHNTHLLRCYSACDHRVREMVLFIKHWAEIRGINSPYHGSLSSYGYVLMVLHYLINVVQPFVCPNLQNVRLNSPESSLGPEKSAALLFKDKNIKFWGDERQINEIARQNMLNLNRDPVGMLVRGFFEYFAGNRNGRGFNWSKDVLSLRSVGGLLTKQEKGWVGARTVPVTRTVAAPVTNTFDTAQVNDRCLKKTTKRPLKTITETREIRHRYLLAIEDPFELEHNVARTVNHNGILSIRNEFRRAWKTIRDTKSSNEGRDKLLESIPIQDGEKNCLDKILKLITSTAY